MLYVEYSELLYKYDAKLSYLFDVTLDLNLELVTFYLTLKYFCKLHPLITKDSNWDYILIILLWLSDNLICGGDVPMIRFAEIRKYFNGSTKSKAACLEDMFDIFGLLDFDYEPKEVVCFVKENKILH